MEAVLINYLLINYTIMLRDLKTLFRDVYATEYDIEKFLENLPPVFEQTDGIVKLSGPVKRRKLTGHLNYKVLNFAEYIVRRRMADLTNFNWEDGQCQIGDLTLTLSGETVRIVHKDPRVYSHQIDGCKSLDKVEERVLRFLGPLLAEDYNL